MCTGWTWLMDRTGAWVARSGPPGGDGCERGVRPGILAKDERRADAVALWGLMRRHAPEPQKEPERAAVWSREDVEWSTGTVAAEGAVREDAAQPAGAAAHSGMVQPPCGVAPRVPAAGGVAGRLRAHGADGSSGSGRAALLAERGP